MQPFKLGIQGCKKVKGKIGYNLKIIVSIQENLLLK